MSSNTLGNLTKDEIVLPSGRLVTPGRKAQQFMLFYAFFVAFPIFDLPGFGLSLTMPLMGLMFFELYLKSPHLNTKPFKAWYVWCYFFLIALALSLVYNGIIKSDAFSIGSSDLFNLAAFGFWIISFSVLIVMNGSYPGLMERIVRVLAYSIIALGILVLAEFALGLRTAIRNGAMTQNDYGFQFTVCFAYAFYMAFVSGGSRRLLILGLIVLLVAVAMNGSRTSFITVGVSSALCTALLLIGMRKRVQIITRIAIGLVIFAVVLPYIPQSWIARFNDRVETLDSIDTDKSYLVRQLLIQKAERLFAENPVFGVGLGRFSQTSTDLSIMRELSYAREEFFNKKSGHNAYMTLTAETGSLGIGMYGGLVALLAIGGFKAVLKGIKRGQSYYIPIYVSFISMSIHLWTVAALTNSLAWFCYALVAGIIIQEKRIEAEQKALRAAGR